MPRLSAERRAAERQRVLIEGRKANMRTQLAEICAEVLTRRGFSHSAQALETVRALTEPDYLRDPHLGVRELSDMLEYVYDLEVMNPAYKRVIAMLQAFIDDYKLVPTTGSTR